MKIFVRIMINHGIYHHRQEASTFCGFFIWTSISWLIYCHGSRLTNLLLKGSCWWPILRWHFILWFYYLTSYPVTSLLLKRFKSQQILQDWYFARSSFLWSVFGCRIMKLEWTSDSISIISNNFSFLKIKFQTWQQILFETTSDKLQFAEVLWFPAKKKSFQNGLTSDQPSARPILAAFLIKPPYSIVYK